MNEEYPKPMKKKYSGLIAIKIFIDGNVFTNFTSACYATKNFSDISDGCNDITHDPKQEEYFWHDWMPN